MTLCPHHLRLCLVFLEEDDARKNLVSIVRKKGGADIIPTRRQRVQKGGEESGK
jgi:hypothetical protein